MSLNREGNGLAAPPPRASCSAALSGTPFPFFRHSITPDWPAPARVRSLVTTRLGGASQGRYASFNLGLHVGDDPAAVATNRAQLAALIGASPRWLEQVHGIQVIDAAQIMPDAPPPQADAAFSRQPGVPCVVMTADCLPVLLCDEAATGVAAVHAGWRSLLGGVLEESIAALSAPGENLLAWLGPAIGPQVFEVGGEVRDAFIAADRQAAAAFVPAAPGKWLADIYQLARQRLAGRGVTRIYGGAFCTVSESGRFYSYRREGQTGRMASVVWLE